VSAPDVAVVGGGLIGMLTAAELAERGAKVVVLEKDDVGFEQSARSVAAVNLPGGQVRGSAGPSNGDAPRSMLQVSADEWRSFDERWDCDIDLNDEGWHIVIADDEDEEWVSIDRATWKETAGYSDSEVLDVAAARERFPQLVGRFRSLDVRHGGHVDARKVMAALCDVAGRLGVEVRRDTLTTGFTTTDHQITAIRTQRGTVPCGVAVIAAGMWSPDLCDLLGFHIPMQRVRAPAAETGPVAPKTIPGFLRASTFGARQNRDGTIRITGGYRYSAMLHDLSFRDLRDLRVWGPALWKNRKDVSLRVDRRVLSGEVNGAWKRLRAGRNGQTFVPQGYEPTSRPRDRMSQFEDLRKLIPALGNTRIERAFAGVMDLMPDLQPVIGAIPGWDNAFVCTGLSGHGYMYGPGACQATARLVLEQDGGMDLDPYRPERLGEKLAMRDQIF
jgi:glycine/D-amino acid oxidase-like deaminating enzyme